MVGIPARPVAARSAPPQPRPEFRPYALGEGIPDPVARALNGLLGEVASLRARLTELERAGRAPGAAAAIEIVEPTRGNGADDDERPS